MDRKSLDQIPGVWWGTALLDAGWTVLPNALARYQAELGLTSSELNLIYQLFTFRRGSGIFPSVPSVAQRMGVSERYVQKLCASLERKGYLKRHPRYTARGDRGSNQYDFSGLMRALESLLTRDLGDTYTQCKGGGEL